MVEPYSFQLNSETVINLRILERVFDLVRCPVYVSVHGDYVETRHSVNVWVDSGESLIIDPALSPELVGVDKGEQLSPDNERLLSELFYDAERLGSLTNIDENFYEITICEVFKLANGMTPLNRWMIWRPFNSWDKLTLTRLVKKDIMGY